MAGVGADVLQVQRGPRPELALEVEAPLVLARVGKMPRGRDDVGCGARAHDAQRARERQRGVDRIRGER